MTLSGKKSVFIGTGILAIAFVGGYLVYTQKSFKTSNQLPLYFNYSAETLSPLKNENSKLMITSNELKQWDEVMFDLVKKNKVDADSSRIYAYVYTAQRDAAFISHNLKSRFEGSIGPVTQQTLCQFFPNDCSAIEVTETDPYSNKLAEIVLEKLKVRIKEDKAQEKPYAMKTGANYWAGTVPHFGQSFGSWKTWVIKTSSQFRAPNPPTEEEWQLQLSEVKKARAEITEEQKKAVVFWAGGPGTITPPGLWLDAANNYMWEHNIPLEKELLVRSTLAMATADSIAAVFDSKYTYAQKRPFMRDHTIQTVMPTPNHPSYPAGHSAISGAAAVVLDHYFPENAKQWNSMADEASLSRVWGGIHFPIDTKTGMDQGRSIGKTAVHEQ